MSELEHISTIARRVVADTEQRQDERQGRVIQATADFLSNRPKRRQTGKHRAKRSQWSK